MRMLKQLGILLLICFIGEGIAMVLPISFPGSVISMVLLFVCFLTRWIKPENMYRVTNFLLQEMAIFFIPSGVGIITVFETVKNSAVAILIICIISTLLTFVATAYTVKLVLFLQNLHRKRKECRAE